MAKLMALYKTPADTAAFDSYYFSKHVPLAKKIPGLKRYEINAAPIASPTGSAPYYLVATLEFDSMSALQKGLGSLEGAAAAGDLANFAHAGVDMLMFDTKEV